MVQWLIEPLQFAFFLRGLIGGLLAAVVCGSLSVFVVWRGLGFAGDALAHSILPGVVLAYAFGFSLLLGAMLAALVAVLGIGLISRHGHLGEDTAIGVMFVGLFALGLILMNRVASFQDLSHVLFGNVLGVSRGDLAGMTAVVVLVLSALILFRKELLVTSFDPAHAVAIGLNPGLVRYGLLGALALTTVVGVQAVGVVLVLALLITPAAAAAMLTRRLRPMLWLSLGTAVGATVVGFYVSWYADIASGPAIVLVLTGAFVLAALWERLSRAVQRQRVWASR